MSHGALTPAHCVVILGALQLAPLASAASPFEGDQVCAQCHREEAAHYRSSPMAQALESAPRCSILKEHPDLTFQEGAYKSRITREGDRALLIVTDGHETLTVPLLWAFGRGQA